MARKNTTAKVAAIIALIAIVGSILSTGVLVIYESYFSSPNAESSLTPDQLQEFLNSFSGANSQSGVVLDESASWITLSGAVVPENNQIQILPIQPNTETNQ